MCFQNFDSIETQKVDEMQHARFYKRQTDKQMDKQSNTGTKEFQQEAVKEISLTQYYVGLDSHIMS